MVSNQFKELQFVMDKDLLEEQYIKYNINYKLAKLECRKLQMQHNVAKSAPYLALDIPEIEEFTLSLNLPIPKKKKHDVFEKTKKLLADATMRNQIFFESSSSRSKSSRSSIVEFPY